MENVVNGASMEVPRDQMGDYIHGNSPRIISQEQLETTK
jgi:hypothetical protein